MTDRNPFPNPQAFIVTVTAPADDYDGEMNESLCSIPGPPFSKAVFATRASAEACVEALKRQLARCYPDSVCADTVYTIHQCEVRP